MTLLPGDPLRNATGDHDFQKFITKRASMFPRGAKPAHWSLVRVRPKTRGLEECFVLEHFSETSEPIVVGKRVGQGAWQDCEPVPASQLFGAVGPLMTEGTG